MGELAQGTGRELTPCEKDPEAFFPEGYLGNPRVGETDLDPDYHSDEAMAARALCAGCWFKDQCLELGIIGQQPYGLWGGLDPDELITEGVRRALHNV